MRILIIQNGCTTELTAPDTLAGLVFAIKDHFDNIDKGSMSVIWDKPAAHERAAAGAIITPSLIQGEKKQNSLAKER